MNRTSSPLAGDQYNWPPIAVIGQAQTQSTPPTSAALEAIVINRDSYKPHELAEMTPADIALAQVIVETALASWTIDGRFRANERTAKFFGTTARRLRRIFPESWYSLDCDTNTTWVILPADIRRN